MQTSTFASIVEAAQFVERQAQGRQLTDKEKADAAKNATVKVLGLPAVSSQAQAAACDKKLQKILGGCQSYVADAEVLKKELAEAGVTPLVVLPAGLWKTIYRGSNLYNFHPSFDGTVAVSSQFSEVPREAVRYSKGFESFWTSTFAGWCYFFAFAATYFFAAGKLDIYSEVWTLSWGGSVFGSMILGALSASFLVFALEYRMAGHASYIRKEVKEAGGIYQFLWPQHTDEFVGPSPYIKVAFPTPPQGVQETLFKMYEASLAKRLRLTVDTGAISFVSDPVQAMIADADKIDLEIKEQERRAAAADPIITVSGPGGHAIAIVAQYGDFPVEEAAVKKAVDEYSFAD